jgi:hypothetical protein
LSIIGLKKGEKCDMMQVKIVFSKKREMFLKSILLRTLILASSCQRGKAQQVYIYGGIS